MWSRLKMYSLDGLISEPWYTEELIRKSNQSLYSETTSAFSPKRLLKLLLLRKQVN